MKNILKTGILALLGMIMMTACEDEYSLGTIATITSDQVSFSSTPSPQTPNILVFVNTSDTKGVVYSTLWDLGNGVTAKGDTVTAQYPYAGDYTVSLTLYAHDGSASSRSQVVHIENDDYSLIDKPVYNNLTGGIEATDGKTWVFDRYNNFVAEVAAETGYSINGHMGLGPRLNDDGTPHYGQDWWAAGPDDKSTWKMYSSKFTFILGGTQLMIQNEGEGYGRKASSASVGGFTVTEESGDDVLFNYAGGNYTFSIDEESENPILTLSGNAFMGFYCGTQEYEIIYLTEEVMALRVDNTVEGQNWIFVYCREDLNVAEPPIVKVPKAVPLSEDFEGTTFAVNFVSENMGELTSAPYSNPAPVPVNTSSNVFLYQKSTDFYSNISHTAADYKFDLTTQNKIRVKVYIPSYNDYETEHEVAGDWISNKKLLPQLAVKLQNSDLGENAWSTQTEIVNADLEKDKWLELEFDFSNVSDRTDYDKIVIQFGAEGHAGPGIFFFDDVEFTE